MLLKNYPAMKVNQWLVVADVHLGITKEMYEKGIIMPRQSEILARRINKLKKITRAKKLLMLGDIKHKITGFSIQEKYEFERFFSLLDFKDVTIVKGNHDGHIEKIIPEKVKVRKSFAVGDYFFTHGHRNASTKKRNIVIGHNQPHIRFRDKMKAVYTEPVWVIGKMRNGTTLYIIPAFNELCGATIINKDDLLGPVARELDARRAKVYLMDGTDIGTLAVLRRK